MSRIVILVICVILTNTSKAQLYLGNFIGNTSEEVNGTWNYEIPIGIPIPLKKWKDGDHKILIEPAYTFSQTYFSEPWVFDSDGTTTTAMLDQDPAHEYRRSIWTHQSKIRMWAWETWLGFESRVGKAEFNLFYTPSYIQVGSFRRRFVENNEVIKVRDRFKDKADFYNIRRWQHRLKGSFSLYGVGVGGYLNLTSFFKSAQNLDLQKFGVTLIIRESFFGNLFKFDLGDDPVEEKKNPEMKEMTF